MRYEERGHHREILIPGKRGCAYGGVELGRELQWVKDQGAYSKVKCATFNDWLEGHMPVRHSQAAPLPLELVRDRKLSLGRLQIIVKAPSWQWPVLCQCGHPRTASCRPSCCISGFRTSKVHGNQGLRGKNRGPTEGVTDLRTVSNCRRAVWRLRAPR